MGGPRIRPLRHIITAPGQVWPTWRERHQAALNVQRNNTGSLWADDTYHESSIREPGISTAVSPLADAVEIVDEEYFRKLAGSL